VPEPEALVTITVSADARRSLLRRLYLTGEWQWGIVFGERSGEALYIRHFAPAAPRWGDLVHPFRLDRRYLLGYADAVLSDHAGRVDWAGHWLVRPNSQRMLLHHELAWLQQAEDEGLIDDQTPLMTAGWHQGTLHIGTHKLLDGEPATLPVHIER